MKKWKRLIKQDTAGESQILRSNSAKQDKEIVKHFWGKNNPPFQHQICTLIAAVYLGVKVRREIRANIQVI